MWEAGSPHVRRQPGGSRALLLTPTKIVPGGLGHEDGAGSEDECCPLPPMRMLPPSPPAPAPPGRRGRRRPSRRAPGFGRPEAQGNHVRLGHASRSGPGSVTIPGGSTGSPTSFLQGAQHGAEGVGVRPADLAVRECVPGALKTCPGESGGAPAVCIEFLSRGEADRPQIGNISTVNAATSVDSAYRGWRLDMLGRDHRPNRVSRCEFSGTTGGACPRAARFLPRDCQNLQRGTRTPRL